MAAIDKLYVNTYDELSDLRRWALVYYPELFLYMYDWAITADANDFEKMVNKAAVRTKEMYMKDWKRISSDGTINCAIAYIKSEWGWGDENEAEMEAKTLKSRAEYSLQQIKEELTFPVLNTPHSVDRFLKWYCPLPVVRRYLQDQCGVKEHWYYKLYWMGKKHFIL